MDYENLIERVRLHTGLSQPGAAERLVRATLDALGGCLPIVDRELWAKRLPSELRSPFRAAEYRGPQSAVAAMAAVPAAVGVPQPYAREQTEAVIRLLAQPLDPEERSVLARHLPDELGALVLAPSSPQPSAATGGEMPRIASEPSSSTLSSGVPGSSRPIATARPSDGQSGSVAAWDERRMDHSLGAGRQDDANTMASGRPGSQRT